MNPLGGSEDTQSQVPALHKRFNAGNSEKVDNGEQSSNASKNENTTSTSDILLKDTRMKCIKRYNQVESLEKVSESIQGSTSQSGVSRNLENFEAIVTEARYNSGTMHIHRQSLKKSKLSDVEFSQNIEKTEQRDSNRNGAIDSGPEETDREGIFASFNPDISEIKKRQITHPGVNSHELGTIKENKSNLKGCLVFLKTENSEIKKGKVPVVELTGTKESGQSLEKQCMEMTDRDQDESEMSEGRRGGLEERDRERMEKVGKLSKGDHNENHRLKNLFFNPIKKRVETRNRYHSNKISETVRTDSPEETVKEGDREWFGTRMQKKKKGFRIFLQNLNGIDTSDNLFHFRLRLDDMRRLGINALALPETNLNVRDYRKTEKIMESVKHPLESGKWLATNTPGFQSNEAQQPGGVATILRDKGMERFAGMEKDPAGRWIAAKFYGKKGFLKIYTVYRVCKMSGSGDTTAWTQQQTYFKSKNILDVDPRKKVRKDLIAQLESDLKVGNDLILVGDFNEGINDEKRGIHTRMSEIGLINVFEEKMGADNLPRTYKRGSKCIDHIYVTSKVFNLITSCGIAPFNYFIKSDHRAMYIDIKINRILDADHHVIQHASVRRLKLSSVSAIEKYYERIDEEMSRHKFLIKVERLQRKFEKIGKTIETIKEINELDKQVTDSLLISEKRCSKVHMNCNLEWTPELKNILRNHRWAKNMVKKIKKQKKNIDKEAFRIKMEHAYKTQREWKKKLMDTTKKSKDLRQTFLEERAQFQAEMKGTEASNELKMIIQHEKQRKDAKKINRALKGNYHPSLSTIQIPHIDQYTKQERQSPGFDHYNTNQIWKKIAQTNNGKSIKRWEIVESRSKVEKYVLEWMTLYQGQSAETPLASKEWKGN